MDGLKYLRGLNATAWVMLLAAWHSNQGGCCYYYYYPAALLLFRVMEGLERWAERHSDVLAASRECLSNQHKRQTPVINTLPAPPALGLSILKMRCRGGEGGSGEQVAEVWGRSLLSVGTTLPGLAGRLGWSPGTLHLWSRVWEGAKFLPEAELQAVRFSVP